MNSRFFLYSKLTTLNKVGKDQETTFCSGIVNLYSFSWGILKYSDLYTLKQQVQCGAGAKDESEKNKIEGKRKEILPEHAWDCSPGKT